MKISRIPTGIDSLDNILQGGLPTGSFILLHGEMGAGDFEYALTTAVRLFEKEASVDSRITLPKKIYYISFTRSKEDILKEIAFSFPDFFNILEKSFQENRMEFQDFSDAYFAMSFIPVTWTFSTGSRDFSFESLKWSPGEKNLVENLIDYLDKNAAHSLVIIDSLTSLAQYCLERMEWNDLIMFLRGLQRVAKTWDGIVYAILSKEIFDKRHQEEIAECMDGVMVFEWEKLGVSQRQRIMYMKKFRGVLPVLDKDDIVNFETQISSQKGFDISTIKRVRGR
jgi:KaiC/GvpD/RAD55 family RecA-like ATPase